MAGDIEITDEELLLNRIARMIGAHYDGYVDPDDTPNTWSAAMAVACEVVPYIAKAAKAEAREACAKIADKHLARVPDHCPDREMEDLVAQGYGNAALNIAAAIRSMEVE